MGLLRRWKLPIPEQIRSLRMVRNLPYFGHTLQHSSPTRQSPETISVQRTARTLHIDMEGSSVDLDPLVKGSRDLCPLNISPCLNLITQTLTIVRATFTYLWCDTGACLCHLWGRSFEVDGLLGGTCHHFPVYSRSSSAAKVLERV